MLGDLTGDVGLSEECAYHGTAGLSLTGGYIDYGKPTELDFHNKDEITIMMWIRGKGSTQSTQYWDPISWHHSSSIGIVWQGHSSGDLCVGMTGFSGCFSGANLWSGSSWHHLAVTRSAAGGSFFVDGVKVGTAGAPRQPMQMCGVEASCPMEDGSWNLWIGGDPHYRRFHGCVDEVMVFNERLSSDEVGAVYRAGGRVLTCATPWTRNNCAELRAAGCPSGTYKLRSCAPGGGSCTDWQTECNMREDGGWTLIGFTGPSDPSKQRRSYTQWPQPSKDRVAGGSFLWQGSTEQLRPSRGVMEGVGCYKTESETLDASCKWAHATCDASCVSEVRKLWGWEYCSSGDCVKPSCTTGNIFGQGMNVSYCSGLGQPSAHPSVLGWQLDIHGATHCWAGRGNCCSDAGGSGTCSGSDNGMGDYFAMLWVQ